MDNILKFPVKRKLQVFDTRIRALLKFYEYSDDEELQLSLLSLCALNFILSGEEESPKVIEFLTKVETRLLEFEAAAKKQAR